MNSRELFRVEIAGKLISGRALVAAGSRCEYELLLLVLAPNKTRSHCEMQR